MKKLIPLLLLFLIISCSKRNDQIEYYRISDIYRENKEPFKFGMSYFLQKIYDKDYHFIKKESILEFDLPEKIKLNMDTLKSLSHERLWLNSNQLSDSIYFKGYEDGKFKIKYINGYTSDEDKRVVIEFEEITKNVYEEDIKSISMN